MRQPDREEIAAEKMSEDADEWEVAFRPIPISLSTLS